MDFEFTAKFDVTQMKTMRQTALVICVFVICGVDYQWTLDLVQNLLSAGISLRFSRILESFLKAKKDIKIPNQWSLDVRGFGFQGISP